MARFLADENFDNDLLDRLREALPDLQVTRVQDIGLAATPDEQLLEYAAIYGMVILTHDVNTLVGFAYERIVNGQAMAGVVLVHSRRDHMLLINDLRLMIGASQDEEWVNQVRYIPLT